MADSRGTLPPGWEEKYDSTKSKVYYINHATRETTWEDPRQKYQTVQPVNFPARKQELIQMQELGRNSSDSLQPTQQATTTRLSQAATSTRSTLVKEQVSLSKSSQELAAEQQQQQQKQQQQQDAASQAGQIQYLKSIFPVATDILLKDVMNNSQNDTMKAVEKLTIMGYVTKEEQVALKVQIKTVVEKRPVTNKESLQTRTTNPYQLSSSSTKTDREKEISPPMISRGRKGKEKGEATSFRSEYKSIAKGSNPDLRKGPNNELLISSFISCNGPNSDLRIGRNGLLVKGPQRHDSVGPRNLAKGAAGLAKGTITMGLEDTINRSC